MVPIQHILNVFVKDYGLNALQAVFIGRFEVLVAKKVLLREVNAFAVRKRYI